MRALKEELVTVGDGTAIDYRYYEQILTDCLPKLDDRQRTAIYLRFWNPHSIAEIAKHFGVSWEEADRLIDSAVMKLRKLMREHKYYIQPPEKLCGAADL